MAGEVQAARGWIEYVSYADATGYGQAAAGYVRLLVEAGWRVHWTPWTSAAMWAGRIATEHARREWRAGRAAVHRRGHGPQGRELQDLVARTSEPPPPGVRVVRLLHTLPRFWPALRALATHAGAVRHVGMTVWETDRLSSQWHADLEGLEALLVPCRHNERVFAAAAADAYPVLASLPVHRVAHVRRSALRPPPSDRLNAMRDWLGVGAGDTVFYTINAWDPRKRLGDLIDGYARTFVSDEPVILVVKTNSRSWFDDPRSPDGSRDVRRTVDAILARVRSETGREPGRIALVATDEVADAVIDGLHAIGDVYVSWSRCEGWGLGSFDAASHGRPVIAVGYGGPVDYLGEDWPGRIPHRMVACPRLDGFGWFDPGQRWPEPDDVRALQLMRDAVERPAAWRAHAARGALDIARCFGDDAVTAALHEALLPLVA